MGNVLQLSKKSTGGHRGMFEMGFSTQGVRKATYIPANYSFQDRWYDRSHGERSELVRKRYISDDAHG